MRKVKIPKKKFLLISLILILFIFTIGFSYLNTSLSLNGNLTVKGGLYDVTFDSRGGTLVNPIRILFNGTKGDFPETTKQGYSFSGWYSDPVDGDEYKSYDDVEDNITLYAHWDANEYKIYFAGNGGTNLPEPLTRRFGESFNFPTQIPTRTGYVFQGWLYSSTGNTSATATSNETSIIGKGYAAGALVSNCTACILNTDSDTTYVAIWDATSPQITKISSSSTSYTTNSITFTPTVTDEVGGLQYKWDDGDYTTTNTLTTSTTGNHTLTVKNNAGKTATQTVTINSKKEYNLTYENTSITSSGRVVSNSISTAMTQPSELKKIGSGTQYTIKKLELGSGELYYPSLDSGCSGKIYLYNENQTKIWETSYTLTNNKASWSITNSSPNIKATYVNHDLYCKMLLDSRIYIDYEKEETVTGKTGWQDFQTTTLGRVTKIEERNVYKSNGYNM